MSESCVVQGRHLSCADLEWIHALMAAHGDWHRTALSREICRCWDWKDEAGRYKDMACRSMLLKLERRGLLRLPPRRQCSVNHRRGKVFEPVLHDTEPIDCALGELQPLSLRIAKQSGDRALWQTLLQCYHYLSFSTQVGKSLSYLAFDRQGRTVGALLFGAAAWKVQSRDTYIGWSPAQRCQKLHLVANNMRFLIPPWVRVPHLASHILALVARRISADWQCKYAHPIELLETFVETARFAGTCYRAANWITVGQTTGRTRNDVNKTIQVPIKTVMVYPLRPDFQQRLLEQ